VAASLQRSNLGGRVRLLRPTPPKASAFAVRLRRDRPKGESAARHDLERSMSVLS
jgi:hypothetical protein